MLSEHPADRLIREVIATRRRATPEEVAAIIARMANAPFNEQIVRVPSALRDVISSTHAGSLTIHLAKRTFGERQWIDGTIAADYVADLRRAVVVSTARLLVYNRRSGSLAATITPTADVLPAARRGVRQIENLLVVYSVDRGVLITGYQFSNLTETGVPEDAIWLN